MTQGEIERMPAGIAKAFQELEQRIMNDIIRRIKINNFSTASADWQITRLQQLGESEENIRKWTKSALDLSDMELSLVFNDGVYKEYMKHERAYQVNGMKQIPYADNHTLKQFVAAIERQTKGELENITQNKAVAVAGPGGQILAKPLMDFYRDTLDRASLDIQSGAFDYQSVLLRTVKELKNSGIRSIAYGEKRSDRVDVAVRRAVLTGFRQVQEKINEQTAAELGTDFYEVSYHVGARPTHQPWQGRVYSWQDLHDVCGLGTVTGLHGANCYHDYNPFVPGASVRTYTDEQLDRMIEEENTPKEYQGKAYTTYQALQEQRRLERNARALREEIIMLGEGEADEDSAIRAKARYQGILQQYEDFSGKMDLPMQHERIYLDGLNGNFRLTSAEKSRLAALQDIAKNKAYGIIKPDRIISGHRGAPKTAAPGSVIDHLGDDGKTETRSFYGQDGYKAKDVTNHNHGFPKKHPYGKNGEHAHDYAWGKDGKLASRTSRDLTDQERKENADIL